jgi:hypothetical protein
VYVARENPSLTASVEAVAWVYPRPWFGMDDSYTQNTSGDVVRNPPRISVAVLEFADGVRKSKQTYGAIEVAVILMNCGDGVSNIVPFVSETLIVYEL